MSSKKSEYSPWLRTLIANGPLPLVLLLLWPAGYLIDQYLDEYYARVVMLIGFNIILAVSLQLINGFSGQFSLGHAGFMAVGAYMAAYPAVNLSNRLSDPASCLWFFVTLGILVSVVGTALIFLFWGLRATRKLHRSLPAILLIALIGWILA